MAQMRRSSNAVTGTLESNLDGICQLCTFIPDRLYFATFRRARAPKPHPRLHFFCTDKVFDYTGFFDDFGPLHLGMVYRYCVKLRRKLKTVLLARKKIVHYTTTDTRKRSNAAFLIGAFAVLILKMAPRDAVEILNSNGPAFIPFRDASQAPSSYPLFIGDCIRAINKAQRSGVFDINIFDVSSFEFYRKTENGNMTWIVPGRFLAFSGPHSEDHTELGCTYRSPDFYVPYFKRHAVNAVIRLNDTNSYDPRRFTERGIKHYDLPFDDGTPPPKEVLRKFLSLVESTPGAVAVHCKAGLGRTGTLIACYLIKHCNFSPAESIAWTRICRPGSIIGPQQQYLERIHPQLSGPTAMLSSSK